MVGDDVNGTKVSLSSRVGLLYTRKLHRDLGERRKEPVGKQYKMPLLCFIMLWDNKDIIVLGGIGIRFLTIHTLNRGFQNDCKY